MSNKLNFRGFFTKLGFFVAYSFYFAGRIIEVGMRGERQGARNALICVLKSLKILMCGKNPLVTRIVAHSIFIFTPIG